MYFASDNSGPVHPKVMEAMAAANDGYAMGYGNDPLTGRVQDRIREIFEAPDAVVHFVPTGTAANSLALACMCNSWDSIFCAPESHIFVDECNGPEFYTGGARLSPVGDTDKIGAEALTATLASGGARGVHSPQPGPLSVTQATEYGDVYTLDEISALTDIAAAQGLKTHLDGARFANALVALGCTPADMTWKAGISAVSFGGTKNGLMGAEAVILFDPDLGHEFELRRKRAGHLFSKHRYLAAQFDGALTDDLWLGMARASNASATYLAAGLGARGVDLLLPAPANILFAKFTRAQHARFVNGGAVYHLAPGTADTGPDDELVVARLVCDWSHTDARTDQFLSLLG